MPSAEIMPEPFDAETMGITWEEAAKKARSKKVLFSALKMARYSGELVKMQWVHGIATNNGAPNQHVPKATLSQT